MLLIAVVDERVQARHRLPEDAAATPAIAAIRTAERDILLTTKADATIAALAALNMNLRLIEKSHCVPWLQVRDASIKKGGW